MADDEIVIINVPAPGDPSVVEIVTPGIPQVPSLGPRVTALEESDAEQDARLDALEVASGDPDAVQELIDDSIGVHVAAAEPHPSYDDMPRLTLLFQNGLV